MKILHFSDTHLGFNDLEITNAEGINQREADFYDAFTQVIDAALAIKPDYVIHTGDRNYDIAAKMRLLDLIRKYRIGFDILSASNHFLQSREDYFYKVDILQNGKVLYE